MSLLSGPLLFTFDPASRRLLEVRGTTNLLDPATGDPFKVRISYYSARPTDAPAPP